jgi:hypothetical protein
LSGEKIPERFFDVVIQLRLLRVSSRYIGIIGPYGVKGQRDGKAGRLASGGRQQAAGGRKNWFKFVNGKQ